MLSTAQTVHQSGNIGDVVFITGRKPSKLLLTDLEFSFQGIATQPPMTCSIEQALLLDLDKTTCIFLDESEFPLLTSTSDAQLEQIKRLCQSQGVMWVTADATSTPNGPNTAMITGLARSLRSENTATKFVVLHYSEDGGHLIDILGQVYRKVFLNDAPSTELDFEYMEQGGIVYVPRLYENDTVENIIVKHGREPTPEPQPFLQPDRALTLKHDATGLVSGLYFDDQMIPASPLDREKIRIEVKAMGVNFKDVMVTLGQVEGYLGHDCSGIVSEIGDSVTNVCVGDRVCALGRETFSTTLECNGLYAIRIPGEMSFPDGASIPAVFCTAYYSLVTVGQLQRGESVLIHAAAGGVGQAAIMIAQSIGAEIYATVGHETKKEHLVAVYGLRDDRIFSSRSPNFGQQVREATNQMGIDVVLNSLGGELLRVSWESLAKFGRFVEIGRRDIDRNSRLDMGTFSKSITFASVDLEMLREEKPPLMQSLLKEVIDLFRRGKVTTVTPVKIFSIEALDSAFHGLQSGTMMGKAVIEPLPGQIVKVSSISPRTNRRSLSDCRLCQRFPGILRYAPMPRMSSQAALVALEGVLPNGWPSRARSRSSCSPAQDLRVLMRRI